MKHKKALSEKPPAVQTAGFQRSALGASMAGSFMSALWTPGRAGVSPGFLVVEPGAVAVWNHRHSCLRPCVVCRAQPPPPGSHHASPTS